MKLFSVLIFVAFSFVFLHCAEGFNYADELTEAGEKLRTIIKKSEVQKDLKTQIYEYIANSASGKSTFLLLLQLSHEILNEEEVKTVLEFLTENGVDVMQLFSISIPPTVYEAIQKDAPNKEAALVSLPEIDDLIDIDLAIELSVELLKENSAVQKLYSMLSEPSMLLGVYGVVSKPVFADGLEKLGKGEAKGIPMKRIMRGLTKMFSGKKDKRFLSEADRFLEGMEIILNCDKSPENTGCSTISENIRTSRVEL